MKATEEHSDSIGDLVVKKGLLEEYWFQHRIQSWIIDADTKDIKNMNAWLHTVSTLHLEKDTNM